MTDDFRMRTTLVHVRVIGENVEVRLMKEVVNQGFVTAAEPHMMTIPAHAWMAPDLLEHVIEANNEHLAEMGYSAIEPEDREKILAALPLG